MTLLGWARGKNRLGDDTGMWHAVCDVNGTARAVCTGQVRLAGQLETPPKGARLCRRCNNHRKGK
jgi:hypothetical protein